MFGARRARKLLSIRLFNDEADGTKRWQRNVKDLDAEILCISQFTLYNRLKGNKPDFHLAMQGGDATVLYNLLLTKLAEQYRPDRIKGTYHIIVKKATINRYFEDGVFGAMMQVHIQNDGPVTIEIESPRTAANPTDDGTK